MEIGQMELLIAHWHQILFVIGIIVVAVRLESEVKNLRKDVDEIQKKRYVRRNSKAKSRDGCSYKTGICSMGFL